MLGIFGYNNRVVSITALQNSMGISKRDRGGQWPSPKSLRENMCFSLYGKIKIMNIKEDYRNGKEKKKGFNYVSKVMLELIVTNKDFLSGCVLAKNSHFF